MFVLRKLIDKRPSKDELPPKTSVQENWAVQTFSLVKGADGCPIERSCGVRAFLSGGFWFPADQNEILGFSEVVFLIRFGVGK